MNRSHSRATGKQSLNEDAWQDAFRRFQAYVRREGHGRIPHAYRESDGYALGAWVNQQRVRYQNGTLNDNRYRRLARLRAWTWDAREDAWEAGFARVQAFATREGHSRVPHLYRDADGYRVGEWVQNRRKDYRQGTLDDEHRRRLEGLPGWTWDVVEDAWEDGFARLRRFVRREGHGRVPRSYLDGDGYRLGPWVSHQRVRHRQGTLREDRRRRLEALPGWTWTRLEDKWEAGFARLECFVRREGHSRVERPYRDRDGYPLGQWVAAQLRGHQRGKLGEERRLRLEALPGWTWNRFDAAWEDGFTRLQEFVEREGHSRAPQDYRDADGYRLGQWVSTQRQKYRQGALKNKRRRRLAALPGWTWNTRKSTASRAHPARSHRTQSAASTRLARSVKTDHQESDQASDSIEPVLLMS